MPFSIVRPTWIFGGEQEILANNIAWILRHMPVFALPGTAATPSSQSTSTTSRGSACDVALADGDVIVDAAGPETISFAELVQAIRRATGSRAAGPAPAAGCDGGRSPRARLPGFAMSSSPGRDQRPDRRPARLPSPAARRDCLQ